VAARHRALRHPGGDEAGRAAARRAGCERWAAIPSSITTPDWVSAGAVGDPGRRTFYLQARQDSDYLAVIVEKEQVAALARTARELLAATGRPLSTEELLAGDLNLEPVQPCWRAGSLRVGADRTGQRFLLEIERAGGDEAPLRWLLGREELKVLAVDAAYAVEGFRERCRRCGQRLNLDAAHTCRSRR
jgi:uncharacterized repeat protein (TIGR03847 family)